MSAEQHGFKAEVQQLLDLMIHSVYSNRDVFLRELISNAADALDKARFRSLTEHDLIPAATDNPGVHLSFDPEARTVVLEDDGIGMTREEVIQNLGTIAHSGTKAFVRSATDAQKADLPEFIGQFGIGFYASFMVADKVVVETRSALAEATGVRWTSSGAGTFEVEDIDKSIRGTRITLHLREDAAEYADEDKIREIVREHSNYVSWPVTLGEDRLNSARALWAEQPSQVSEDDANEFYRELSFDFEKPVARVHLSVDSPLQYSALLFVPRRRPYDLFNPEADRGPRLYARRVLIAEHAKELLPDWLRFVKGVVDSADIPLNVSREMVQKTPAVRAMKDAIVKRLLKELGRVADAERVEGEEHAYDVFWESFGVLLKEGYFHDKASYGDRLLPLLRFHTVKHGDAIQSLAAYKAAMPEGQDTIWYLTGSTREQALASPHLEAFRKKGWDVLLLTDSVDEWFIQGLTEYEGLEVKSVSRGELSIDDDEDGEKADLSTLAPWMQGLFEGAVASVRSSNRLTDSAAVLVDEASGVTSNMERILRAANQDVPTARRHLELNVRHPLVKNLATLHARGASDVAEPIARLLLDDAMLLEGSVKDASAIGRRLQGLLERAASAAVEGR